MEREHNIEETICGPSGGYGNGITEFYYLNRLTVYSDPSLV